MIALKEAAWLIGIPLACWFVYRWVMSILFWSLVVFLILYRTYPEETHSALHDYIIPFMQVVTDWVRTRLGDFM